MVPIITFFLVAGWTLWLICGYTDKTHKRQVIALKVNRMKGQAVISSMGAVDSFSAICCGVQISPQSHYLELSTQDMPTPHTWLPADPHQVVLCYQSLFPDGCGQVVPLPL